MADQPAFPPAALGRAASLAYPVQGAAFPGATPEMMRVRMLQQLAQRNPNLVRSMPGLPPDLLPPGR